MPLGRAPSDAGLFYWLPQKTLDPMKIFNKKLERAMVKVVDIQKAHTKLVKKYNITESAPVGLPKKVQDKLVDNARHAREAAKELYDAMGDVAATADEALGAVVGCGALVQRSIDEYRTFDEETKRQNEARYKHQKELGDRMYKAVVEEIRKEAA